MASWVASHLRADPGRVSLGKATGTTPKLTAVGPRVEVPPGLQRTCRSAAGCAGPQASTSPHRRQVNPRSGQHTQLH